MGGEREREKPTREAGGRRKVEEWEGREREQTKDGAERERERERELYFLITLIYLQLST